MTKVVISEEIKQNIQQFLSENEPAELVNTYLCFIGNKFNIQPVLFPKEKTIYQSEDDVVKKLEKEGALWHETEIKIGFGTPSVNELTKRVYICPFTGKVFGDNTHPNPQDAIYDWVSKCPENKERQGGLPVKRFFVSEDPEIIKNYAEKNRPKEPITKIVFSSVLNGKLFNSKEGVTRDLIKNYLKPMTLVEVQSQNRFEIEESFIKFLQDQLVEDKVTAFLESMASFEEFQPIVARWLE